MKKYILIFITLIGIILSCEKYDPVSPDACLKMEVVTGKNDANLDVFTETTACSVGEACYFSSCGNADFYSVWTGDEGHVYELRNERDTSQTIASTNLGTRLGRDKDAVFIHTYTTAGTYTVTLVATNTSMGSTDVETMVSTATLNIVVSD